MRTTSLRAPTGTLAESAELRQVKRYQLSVPVVFTWRRRGEVLEFATGITRDISMRGVFILTQRPPEPLTFVELDAYLIPDESGPAVRLHADGRVLRTETRPGSFQGFAAEVFFEAEPAVSAKRRNQ